MKRFALLTATLMLGGAALAQDTTYDDPSTAESTAVQSDTSVAPDTSVDTTATPDANTTMSHDMMQHETSSTASTTSTTTVSTTGESTATGVGGPYEAAPGTMAVSAPSSKGGYPPCDPGPGDDNCIQLYERGVSTPTNLALNNSLPGGSETMMASAAGTSSGTMTGSSASTTSSSTGMGGPYEPVDGSTAAAATSADDYPPCSGAPSDDRCIQLYERGVTGRDD